MGIGRTNASGAGGAALNFTVVPGLTQPGSAAENTIWVKTDRLNKYYFSATKPENMANYDVWFITGSNSFFEFNALKKNGIQVYPISAKQYIDGVLVTKVAMIYISGSWEEWVTYIYKDGWLNPNLVSGFSYDSTCGNLLQNSDSCVYTSTDGYPHGVNFKEKVDVNGASYLCMEYESANSEETRLFGLATKDSIATRTIDVASMELEPTTGKTIVKLAISSVAAGSYYIKWSTKYSITVYRTWLSNG